MKTECNEGKRGCKYRGDLDEICGKYRKGVTPNGEPIWARDEFPLFCKACADRDFDFCVRFKDLICFNHSARANVNCSVLSEYLEFLLKQGLIEERPVKQNRIIYAVTQHGLTVLKAFRELEQALPILEEERKTPPLF